MCLRRVCVYCTLGMWGCVWLFHVCLCVSVCHCAQLMNVIVCVYVCVSVCVRACVLRCPHVLTSNYASNNWHQHVKWLRSGLLFLLWVSQAALSHQPRWALHKLYLVLCVHSPFKSEYNVLQAKQANTHIFNNLVFRIQKIFVCVGRVFCMLSTKKKKTAQVHF